MNISTIGTHLEFFFLLMKRALYFVVLLVDALFEHYLTLATLSCGSFFSSDLLL